MELIDIVDSDDTVIGKATREDIYKNLYPHRIVHILIFNSENKMALQKVAKNKPPYAGHWGTSVGGHVQTGESYEQAAMRELLEEFGIKKANLEKIADTRYITPLGQLKIMRIFRSNINQPLHIDPIETEKIEYFSLDEVKHLQENGDKFAPELLQIIKECL